MLTFKLLSANQEQKSPIEKNEALTIVGEAHPAWWNVVAVAFNVDSND